ncbi:hypothetical protein [Corynebacterium striatum]|uniref:hypothetical protein n=1 Tax=Corynebacterium striatum TaxID=43770 RepID=UPI00254D4205|nr:hypothetical protein [Corynebacterium striatum]MDK8876391.1 hypothetical protein [Corynebacterium striatum]
MCYFVIMPAGAGDTATVVDALGWPAWVQLVMCAVGVAGMFATAWHFAPYIKRFAGDDRKAQWAMAFWPWLIGTAAMCALQLLYVAVSNVSLSIGEKSSSAFPTSACSPSPRWVSSSAAGGARLNKNRCEQTSLAESSCLLP